VQVGGVVTLGGRERGQRQRQQNGYLLQHFYPPDLENTGPATSFPLIISHAGAEAGTDRSVHAAPKGGALSRGIVRALGQSGQSRFSQQLKVTLE
jgi:hypothetical protein